MNKLKELLFTPLGVFPCHGEKPKLLIPSGDASSDAPFFYTPFSANGWATLTFPKFNQDMYLLYLKGEYEDTSM